MKSSTPQEPLALSVEDAARATSLGRTKLFELIRTREIEAVKVGGRTLVPVASLKAFLAKKAAPHAA